MDYSYLGAGSFVKADYTEPDIRGDLAFGNGNDPLDGLDRFDRVVDNRWYNYGTSADACRVQYGYDRAGSRTYREQTVDSHSYFDEVYRYDGVDRLASMNRGPLSGQKTSVSPLKFAQCWGLDATGNWRDFREDSDGNGSWDLVQTRTHNGVNEVSDISETTGPAWITPLYDRAGNMTRGPKPSDATQYYSCTYDAWNRLVKLQDGANTVAEYKYDGAKRRICKKSYSGGSLTETRHLYYTGPSRWQAIEERVGSSTSADRQFVWGVRYIDELVLRDRNADGSFGTGNYGKSGSGLEERLYCLQDANWNVTALANASGTIQERYAYSAYGAPIFLTSFFGARSSSSYDWESLYCGYRFDTLVGLYHIRYRVYAPGLGWLSRDPIGYIDGINHYMYVNDVPTLVRDPLGQAGEPRCCCGYSGESDPYGVLTRWRAVFARSEELTLQQLILRREILEGRQSLAGHCRALSYYNGLDEAFRKVARANGVPDQIIEAIINTALFTRVPRPPSSGMHNYCEQWVDAFLENLRNTLHLLRAT